MKKFVISLALLLAFASPASAGSDWYIVDGYGYPPHIVAGPYASIGDCINAKGAMGAYSAHCAMY